MKNTNFIQDTLVNFIDLIQFKMVSLSFATGLILTSLSTYIKMYVFDDVDFLFVLFVLFFLDLSSGLLKTMWKQKNKFSADKFIKITIKLFNCAMILISVHVLQHYGSSEGYGYDFLKQAGRTTCIIYFMTSILSNAYILSDERLPIGWLIKIIEVAEEKLNKKESLNNSK